MKAIGKHITPVTDKVFDRQGRAFAGLLVNWRELVGADLAAITRPQKLTWPKNQKSTQWQRKGGTLSLYVQPGRALEVEYQNLQILERVNTWFGYGALTSLKLVQRPFIVREPKQTHESEPLPPDLARKIANIAGDTTEKGLRQALTRLGNGVFADNLSTGRPSIDTKELSETTTSSRQDEK